MSKQDVIDEQNQKFLELYNSINESCRQKLSNLRRSLLDNVNALSYSCGGKIPVVEAGEFICLNSILYSDKLDYDQVAHDLMSSMRSWVVSNAALLESIAFVVHGKKDRVELLVSSAAAKTHEALVAAFPGVTFGREMARLSSFTDGMDYGGAITGIPAFGDKEDEQLFSLDVFLRGMRGKRFSVIISGISLKADEVDKMLDAVRAQRGENHKNIKANIQELYGESVANTVGGGITRFGAIMSAVANTHSEAFTKGINAGLNAGGSVGGSIGGMLAKTVADAVTNTTGDVAGTALSLNYSRTKTKNKSHANTLEHLNCFAEAYEEALDEQEDRLKLALNEGGWRTATYFLADSPAVFKFGTSLFKTCLTSKFDAIEPFRIVQLSNPSSNWERTLSSFAEVVLQGSTVALDTFLTSSELAAVMCLPHESHPGIEVRDTPRFSVAVASASDCGSSLGRICDREVAIENEFYLSEEDLSAHALVAGLTGMGKSTTIREILQKTKKTFLVLEPAKSEYRNMVVNGAPVRVYTAGDEDVAPLRINPFELSPNDKLHSHVDALAAIINAAFPMEGPMSALVEQGLLKAYEKSGWDVSLGIPPDDGRIPTMNEFYAALKETVDEQNFQGDYGCNIKSALLTRIRSLCIGPRGRLFNSETEFDIEDLLSTPTVIEMKRLGNDETKTFLSGILLLRIYKYFEDCGESENLKNILVVEEAHRLFRRSENKSDSLVGNNTSHHAVEIFENIMAEVRAYGLGIIIAEQLPLRLSDGAVKNTNLKIIHRLGALEDAIAMGGAVGLDEKRSAFITRLGRGEAIVHCASRTEPFHVRIVKTAMGAHEGVLDAELRDRNPRIKASERRPQYFESVMESIEKAAPRMLEAIADRCWFTISMVPAAKGEKWGRIWRETVFGSVQPILCQIHNAMVGDSERMAAHLLHASIYSLFKTKWWLRPVPKLKAMLLRCWDEALLDDQSISEEKLKAILKLVYSEELTNFVELPHWLPNDLPGVAKFYSEARQQAAAIRVANEQIGEILCTNLNEAVMCVWKEVDERRIEHVDIKGATLENYVLAVVVALLDWARPKGCSTREYMADVVRLVKKGVGQ